MKEKLEMIKQFALGILYFFILPMTAIVLLSGGLCEILGIH